MYMTNYMETAVLNLFRGISITAPQKVYMALFLSNPGESGTGTEANYTGYSRVEVSFSTPAVMSGGIGIQNAEDIKFAIPQAAGGTVTHIGVMDSLSGGNMLVYGPLTDSLSIEANEAPVIVAGEAKWWITGSMSDAYKTKVLNVLRGTNCDGFTPYLALFNGNPENTGAELSGGGYSRVALSFGAPEEQSAGQMMITTAAQAATARATANQGTWAYTAIYDAASNGQPAYYAARSTPKEMRKGLIVIIAAGNLSLAMN
ncbi:MAG: hypothetical protein PUI40_07585 [Oscillospiraceae bacterium]|nr:hypothetical protein [Oscillospiraceae bacterium]MDD7041804.1 hypothetical protein [Oscillospiraceae bacterium]MDY2610455.1 hypothetical protein [Oscillospiraceae bacterium]